MKTKSAAATPDAVRDQVRESYGKIAETGSSCCGSSGGCCGPARPDALATQIGYSAADLADLPEGSNLGLSCGHPTALASLRPGEQVLDLGSGGGFDVFIAGRKVGATGHVIGVDMTSAMLVRARQNLAAYTASSGLKNIEFRLGEIEHLPVADASVDVVISNCVLNLSPDKPQVWREMARVLRPGGRVAVSDLALLQPLPGDVMARVEALIGCISGAVLITETEKMARAAGFQQIQLTPRSEYFASLQAEQDPLYRDMHALLPAGRSLADYITSLEITARK